MARQAKKSLKRTHTEAGLSEDKEVKVDKEEISEKISKRDYDFSVHFSHEFATVVEAEHKTRAFAVLSNSECIVALHNNRCLHYKLAAETSKCVALLGELATHQMAIRGVEVSPSDNLFVTHSFDSVKVWSVDLFRSNQTGDLTIDCR